MGPTLPSATSLLVGLALAAPAPLFAQQAPQPTGQPSRTFPSAVDVVTVDVVVLDREGRPVEGLTQADFTIKEDGRPQTVSSFEAVTLAESPEPARPRTVVATNAGPVERTDRWFFVVFDDVNVSAQQTARAHQVLAEFLARGPRDGDSVMIATASGSATWTGRMPEDRQSLQTFARRLEGLWRPEGGPGRIWDHEAMAIATGRDRQLQAQVVRRYFENNLVPEAFPSRELNRDLDVAPGLQQIRVKARETYAAAAARLRTTLSSLERVARAVADRRGRKTLLLVSEGFIMDPSQPEFRDLVRTARDANAAVYYVDVRSPGGVLGQAGLPGGGAEFGRATEDQDATTALAFSARATEGARSIAIDTGGGVISGSDVVEGMVKVARSTRAYYLIGYDPANTARDGKYRRIEVSVNRPGVDVHARRGYYAPSSEQTTRATAGLDPAVRAALDSPLPRAGIPLRLTSYVGGEQAPGKLGVLLVAEADPAPLGLQPRGGRYEAQLDSYVVVHGRDQGTVETRETLVELSVPEPAFQRMQQSGVPLRRELALAPGAYQARLLLRDRASGAIGSVVHSFDVPQPNGFRVSTPVLTDALQPVDGGQPLPVPVAHRRFAAGASIAVTFEVFGAEADAARGGPRVMLSYRLLGADGAPLGSAQQALRAAEGGRIAPLLVVALPAGGAGEHALELTLRDELTGAAVEIEEPFTIG